MSDFAADKVAVIGMGSWGTAAAGLLARNAAQVCGWALEDEVARGITDGHRNPLYLSGYELPDNVRATTSLEEAVEGAEAVIVVVPSAFMRSTASSLASLLGADVPVCVLTKGIEPETMMLMTQVVADVCGGSERMACLSGPTHAEEICQGKPAAAVVASSSEPVADLFRSLFISQAFRAYVSSDLVGVEVCGAVKNVVAIACGIARGLELGDNTTAVLMTRGLAEIGRLACAMGAEPMTCMGLAGMGDLATTCMSPHSRNRTFGAALVAGETLEEYQARTRMVVEGAVAARSAHELAHRLGVDAPIVDAVHAVLYDHASVPGEMRRLLDRMPYDEFYGLGDRA
ncbi:NAD(P)H-dependent glycerol-3-phosphate dehydrogenase [Atopobiaceae bacterium 24-176]